MKEADIFEKVKNIEREIRELCDKRYRDGVSDGFDDGYNQGYFDAKGTKDDEIREQGRKDAWECARKMVLSDEDGGIALSDILKIFGMTQYSAMKRFSASEAIAKIKEYEENQKRTCDTCQYLHGGFNSIKKCANCYGNSGWTPKQTEQRCKSKMTIDEAIAHGKEQLEVFGGEHREFIEMTITALEQTRWIPVTERLPKTADVYRVTRYYLNNVMNPKYIVDACFFDGSNTWYNDNRINHERNYADNIIAWQENPEPYKTESEE